LVSPAASTRAQNGAVVNALITRDGRLEATTEELRPEVHIGAVDLGKRRVPQTDPVPGVVARTNVPLEVDPKVVLLPFLDRRHGRDPQNPTGRI
jgi:hypothetical protein